MQKNEGVTLIKEEQLKGFKTNDISKQSVEIIQTNEKNEKVSDLLVSLQIYKKLEDYFIE